MFQRSNVRPGSCHDRRIFETMSHFTHPQDKFANGEFLLGDSAYGLTPYMLVPYIGRHAQQPENAAFNIHFSAGRVLVEHTIGILKSRFTSLKGLRTQIRERKDFKLINDWIVSCLVLHNFVTSMRDPAFNIVDVELNEAVDNGEDNRVFDGAQQRENIKALILERYYE